MPTADVRLRPATPADANDIASILHACMSSFEWLARLHTLEDDRAFVSQRLLPHDRVLVAETARSLVGFIAVRDEWVEQLYLDPAWTNRGIGARLLAEATAGLTTVKLYCFQANALARHFYEREGFRPEVFGDGANNEEGLPDILYVRRS